VSFGVSCVAFSVVIAEAGYQEAGR
jgi:hypothetical protein